MDLDAWLPDPQVRTHHRRRSDAPADAVWESARSLKLSDTRSLGRLVRWRLPRTPAGATFVELLSEQPFTVLDEGERHSISGLCGRIWTFRYDYAELSGPEEYLGWDERGTVRVLFANWVEEDAEGRSVLCDEARVAAVDRGAAMRLRILWATIGRFEGVIGNEAVGAAVRRAERATASA